MRIFFPFLFCMVCLSIDAQTQTFRYCDVYQFGGTDSAKKKIALKKTFNSNGNVISETYSDYKSSAITAGVDGTYFYFYKDTLLVKRTFVDDREDSTKMLCYYDAKNQLTRQEHFDYKRRLRKDCDKGNGRPGGCIVTEKDYEKNRTWMQTSEVNYTYDASGNRILYDATELHFTTQNRYTWVYDSLGRVLKYCSYNNQRLYWIEEFSYGANTYSFTRTWYDYHGTPEHLAKETWSYVPQYTSTFSLDSVGRVLKRTVTTEKGETRSIETYSYNTSGQLLRSVHADGNGEAEVTHIYVYR